LTPPLIEHNPPVTPVSLPSNIKTIALLIAIGQATSVTACKHPSIAEVPDFDPESGKDDVLDEHGMPHSKSAYEEGRQGAEQKALRKRYF
jgi:hypothetical protein